MSNLLARIGTRKMPSQDVQICLDFTLLNARDEAMKAVARAQSAVRAAKVVEDERMAAGADREPASVTDAKQRVADLEGKIREASLTLRLRGVDRATYYAWMMACPPRKGRQESYDSSKFFMVAAKASAVYVDEQGDEHPISADEWAEIDKVLTDGEYDRLAQAVLHVNREAGHVDVAPFVTGSETTQDSFGISASRARSGSRRAASGAGSQSKSTPKKKTSKAAASSE